jgi:hypothetical protein
VTSHKAESPTLKAYKEMEPVIYNGVACLLFLMEIIGSILIPNVATVFDFISVFSMSSINFIFPGLFYYLCNKKFGNQRGGFKHYMSIAYMVGGLFMAAFIFVNTCSQLA